MANTPKFRSHTRASYRACLTGCSAKNIKQDRQFGKFWIHFHRCYQCKSEEHHFACQRLISHGIGDHGLVPQAEQPQAEQQQLLQPQAEQPRVLPAAIADRSSMIKREQLIYTQRFSTNFKHTVFVHDVVSGQTKRIEDYSVKFSRVFTIQVNSAIFGF